MARRVSIGTRLRIKRALKRYHLRRLRGAALTPKKKLED